MYKNIKSKCTVIALLAIALTFLINGTLAFYSTSSTTTNVVTTGGIKFLIHETTDKGENFPTDGIYIVPGDVVSKRVNIESDCNQPFYLRVKMVYDIDSQELTAQDCFNLDINTQYWELHDGWYYYTGIVNPDETTPNVFSNVEIVGSKVDNNHLGKTLKITVVADAVQSKNNPLTDGKTYTASGWPN